MSTRQQTSELSRTHRRRAIRARARSKVDDRGPTERNLTEYRGRESYEQQTSEGRGGQSDMFDQRDYPPRTTAQGEPPPEDDGQLVPLEDRRI